MQNFFANLYWSNFHESLSNLKGFMVQVIIGILSKLNKPLGKCSLAECSNITSSVNPSLLKPLCNYLFL